MKLFAAFVVSFTMAVVAPLADVGHAQSVTTAKLQQIKQKAASELDRRMQKLEQAEKNLDSTVTISGSSVADKIVFAPETKSKSKKFIEDYQARLVQLKQKMQSATALTDAQKLATAIDSQYVLDKTVASQGAVTKAIESMTLSYDKLKIMSQDLESQIDKVRECADNSTLDGCSGVGTGAEAKADTADAKLNVAKQQIASVQSLLLTTLTLQKANIDTVGTVTNKLGNLSNLMDVSGNTELKPFEELQSSFKGVTSQATIAYTIAASAQYILAEVATMTDDFGL